MKVRGWERERDGKRRTTHRMHVAVHAKSSKVAANPKVHHHRPSKDAEYVLSSVHDTEGDQEAADDRKDHHSLAEAVLGLDHELTPVGNEYLFEGLQFFHFLLLDGLLCVRVNELGWLEDLGDVDDVQ